MNRSFLILLVCLPLLLFVAGCMENLDSVPQQLELAVGESGKISVSFSGWFNEFKNAEIISGCKQVFVNSSKIIRSTSGMNPGGTIEAEIMLKEHGESLKNCLAFKSSDYTKTLDTQILSSRQAYFSSVTFEKETIYNNDYRMDFVIVVNEKSKENNFSIKFSTSSPKVTIGAESLDGFVLTRKSNIDTGTLTPNVTIRIGDTGDASRQVIINTDLFAIENGAERKLDSKTTSTTATRGRIK